MSFIKFDKVTKDYHSGEVTIRALSDASFEVEKGEICVIVGESGAGKTTLLNILGGMDSLDEGTYLFEDEPVSSMNARQLAHFRNKKVGFVFQSFHLLPEFNVMDNVALPLGYGGAGAKERKARAMELLEKEGLKDKAKRKPSQLSGGEQQRVAIARAIAADPDVLLADEPTGSLDEENGIKVMDMLKTLNDQGLTIVLVTHDAKVADYAHRLLHMSDGKLEEQME